MARIRKSGRSAGRSGGRRSKPPAPRPPDAIVPARSARVVDEVVQIWNTVGENSEKAYLALCARVHRDIFDGDTKAMLAPRRVSHPKYAELLSRAGHGLGVARAKVFELVRFAGWDRTVGGNFWKHLKPAQKTALLPLAESKAMQEGAQHAVEFDLGEKQIRAWVNEQKVKGGGKQRRRRVTKKTVETSLAMVNDLYGNPAALAKLDEIAAGMDADERRRLAQAMTVAAGRLAEAARKLQP